VLQQQVSEYEERIGQYDLAATKAFKEKYDNRIEDIMERGKNAIVRTGLNPEETKQILDKLVDAREDITAMEDIVADMPVAVQGALFNLMQDYDAISKERADALTNWQDTRKAADYMEARDREIRLMDDIEKDVGQALTDAVKEGNWLYARTEDPEWSKQVDERISTAKGLLKLAKPSELAKYVLEGVTAKDTRALFTAAANRVRQLEQDLADLQGATPGIRARPQEQPRQPQAPSKNGTTPEKMLDTLF